MELYTRLVLRRTASARMRTSWSLSASSASMPSVSTTSSPSSIRSVASQRPRVHACTVSPTPKPLPGGARVKRLSMNDLPVRYLPTHPSTLKGVVRSQSHVAVSASTAYLWSAVTGMMGRTGISCLGGKEHCVCEARSHTARELGAYKCRTFRRRKRASDDARVRRTRNVARRRAPRSEGSPPTWYATSFLRRQGRETTCAQWS